MAASRFLLISPPRTGSTSVRMAFSQMSGVYCHGEVLAKNRPLGFFKMPEGSAELREKDRFKFYESTAIEGFTTTGIKLLYKQMFDDSNAGLVQSLIERQDIPVLHLWRRDLCARYISGLNFMAAKNPPAEPLVASTDAMLADFRNHIAHYKWAHQLFAGHPSTTICFEDLVTNDQSIWDRVQDVLDLPRQTIKLPNRDAKQKKGFVNHVANAAELQAFYATVKDEFEQGF